MFPSQARQDASDARVSLFDGSFFLQVILQNEKNKNLVSEAQMSED
jgi:hypothetical protein